jgi:hypothetical protein
MRARGSLARHVREAAACAPPGRMHNGVEGIPLVRLGELGFGQRMRMGERGIFLSEGFGVFFSTCYIRRSQRSSGHGCRAVSPLALPDFG